MCAATLYVVGVCFNWIDTEDGSTLTWGEPAHPLVDRVRQAGPGGLVKRVTRIDHPSGDISSKIIVATLPPRPPRLRVPKASRDGVAMERSLGAIPLPPDPAVKWDHPTLVPRRA